MATVRSIVSDAYLEIGVLPPGQTMSPSLGALGLLRFQNQLDAWQARRLMLSIQTPTEFTLTSGTSTVTIGTGGDVNVPMPMWLDTVNYVNPGSNPEVEVPIGQMTPDIYAGLSIKELQNPLPTQCFFQRSPDSRLASLFFWPQVTQNVTIRIYYPQGVGIPATLNSTVIGAPGYARAFMYDLAFDLCGPTGTAIPDSLPMKRSAAMKLVESTNVQPGILGVDPATTNSTNSGYNILTDQVQATR